jgi:GT2 family glycosyltransferase
MPNGPTECRFSVIIVHRNGRALIMATLAALHAGLDSRLDEVILVDNGSRDDSLAAVREAYPDIRVIANPCNNGFARANNQAIAVAHGQYLLLLNSDAQLAPDGLARLAAHFEAHHDVGVIGARLVGEDGKAQNAGHDFPSLLGEFGLAKSRPHSLANPCPGLYPVPWTVGACMAVRRQAVDQAGPLDGDFFFYYEDVEWCLRLSRHGWGVALAGDVDAVHVRGGSTVVLRRESLIEQTRSRMTYYRKAFPPRQAQALVAYRVVRLALGSLVWGTLNLLTLGRIASARRRSLRYAYPLLWLLRGMPESWGLPGRCAERQVPR